MPCQKVRFPSLETARAALVDAKIRASLHHNRRRREQRVYFCPQCCSWHLTSRIGRGEAQAS